MNDGEYKFRAVINNFDEFIILGYDLDNNEIKLPLIYPTISDSFSFIDLFNTMQEMASKIPPELKEKIMSAKENNSFDEETISAGSDLVIFGFKSVFPKVVEYFKWAIEKKQGSKLSEEELKNLEEIILENLNDIIIPKLNDFLLKIFKGSGSEKKLLRVKPSKIN